MFERRVFQPRPRPIGTNDMSHMKAAQCRLMLLLLYIVRARWVVVAALLLAWHLLFIFHLFEAYSGGYGRNMLLQHILQGKSSNSKIALFRHSLHGSNEMPYVVSRQAVILFVRWVVWICLYAKFVGSFKWMCVYYSFYTTPPNRQRVLRYLDLIRNLYYYPSHFV